MIFVTVGSAFSFDRLVTTVDEAVGKGLVEEEVFAQIGSGGYRPQNMRYSEVLEKSDFDRFLLQSSGIISHAGIGTISMALDYGKPLLAMPRRKSYGELVNDHQIVTAKKFEALGYILVADDEKQLLAKIGCLKRFVPKKREVQTEAVAQRIGLFLRNIIE